VSSYEQRRPGLGALLFGLRAPVGRRTYLMAGLALLGIKYAVDIVIVYFAVHAWWSPIDYLIMPWNRSLPGLGKSTYSENALFGVLALWSLPFAWIGISMTMRRCVDAAVPAGLALLFFMPIVKYLVIVPLCVIESRPGLAGVTPSDARDAFSKNQAVFAGTISGVIVLVFAMAFSVFAIGAYGGALFIGSPFVSGFVAAYVLARGRPTASLGESFGAAILSLVIASTAFLLVAWEGLFCLVMAVPLGGMLAILGAVLGRALGQQRVGPSPVLALLCVWPLLTAAEAHTRRPEVRELLSVVEVDRAPEEVWPHVIAFRELPAPHEWFFQAGIAYPQRARIEGHGVGALRYCEFSTGPFIEPITVWQPPSKLAFSVIQQPQPMTELSPYREVMAPHLHDNLRSHRGEFHLVRLPGNRTRIEARTWYSIDMYPAAYWQLWSDTIIHAIHMRVLVHVRRETLSDQRALNLNALHQHDPGAAD
jgi:uncharacterized membrane protein YhaH (DUF805 family)